MLEVITLKFDFEIDEKGINLQFHGEISEALKDIVTKEENEEIKNHLRAISKITNDAIMRSLIDDIEKDIRKVTKNNEADSFFDDLEKLLKKHQSKKEELESTLKEILKELRK